MRVVFAPEVLADESVWLQLAAILAKVDDGWHLWHCADIAGTEQSAFVTRGGRSVAELLRTAVMSESWNPTRRLHTRQLVVSLTEGAGTLAPTEARRFLETPVRVLMENRFSDGDFLDVVLTVLGDPETMQLKARGALEYDHAGGAGDLPKLVRLRREQAPGGRLRALAFTDSDSRFPSDVSAGAKLVGEACAVAGIPCVVLRKRAIENYVPDEALVEWVEPASQVRRRPEVEALLRLDATQRDHFPMKKGLPKNLDNLDSDNSIPSQQQQLYARVALADRELLQHAVLPNVLVALFTPGDATSPRQPRASITPDTLRRRDGQGELDRLVELVEAEL